MDTSLTVKNIYIDLSPKVNILLSRNSYTYAQHTLPFNTVDGETMETVSDFILGGSKITADGECSHELKDAYSLEEKL